METLINSEFYSALFIGLGLIFLLLEIFIPSGGILGVLCLGASIFGVYGLFHQGHTVIGLGSILGIIVFVILGIKFGLRRVTSTAYLDPATANSIDEDIHDLLGKVGTTTMELRPAGMAMIEGKKIDVVSAGGFIDRNVAVKVIDNTGNRVVVREVTVDSSSEAAEQPARDTDI